MRTRTQWSSQDAGRGPTRQRQCPCVRDAMSPALLRHLPSVCLSRLLLLLVLLAAVVSGASFQPEKQLQDHIHGEIEEVLSERNRSERVFFDELFFGFGGDSEPEEKDQANNCSCKCGLVNQEIRIVGGRPTGVNRYPWVARILYEGQFHCGGSLLNEDFVLTAAHCVRRLKRSKIRVILGDHNQYVTTDAPAIMRAVSSVIRHRNFDLESYNHDIALLKLRKPVLFTKTIRPVCLPPVDLDPAGKVGTVVGWGRLSEGGSLATEVQEVQVPILTLSQCRSTKYRPSRITPNMVCAGKGKEDSCQGDSGGPLLLNHEGEKYQIVGIVSWGVGCGRPGYPGVYTRVTSYLNWVKRNMRDSCICLS